MAYLEFHFVVYPPRPASEILIAELGELGFESFEETEDGVKAYIPKKQFKGLDNNSIGLFQNPEFEIQWSSREIPQQNWNATWEKNFPVTKVGPECLVRAPFHDPEPVTYDIVIAPKMSFGTGHHETTYMMLTLLLEEPLNGKSVLDMGCGTGVLAILSEKRGAREVDAIDIDPWCYENAMENVRRNECQRIQVALGDVSNLNHKNYDIILANINRNVLFRDIPVYLSHLNQPGSLLLSGFYLKDLNAISTKCEALGLQIEKKVIKNDWVAAKYVH